jgi:anti-sigma-K factor RskA
MSSTAPQPDSEAADEIVAYLDGELPPPDCRRVEDRLATDEKYRQQLHELDRAWEALDALPTTSAGEDFARTTIELACVAAKDDVKERAATLRVQKQKRLWRWIAASAAALAIGILAGLALMPNPNKRLLADLPAIHQVNVLPFVENIDVLRQISNLVPTDQMVKDDQAFGEEVNEIRNANSTSPSVRRDWLKSLPSEQKAELADRARVFSDLQQSPEQQQRMRKMMDEIRSAPDAAKLEDTLAAYGHWVLRHTAGQQEELRGELARTPPGKKAEFVRTRVERESELAMRHLSPEDAEKFRTAIFQIMKERRPDILEHLPPNRQASRAQNAQEQLARQAMAAFGGELLKGNPSRQEIQNELVSKLGPDAKAQWDKLGRRQRDFGRGRQLAIWFRDAMNLKVDPEELERFFANDDKLTPDQRERLLNQSRSRLDSELERLYLSSELGIDVSQFGDSGPPPRGVLPNGKPMRRPADPGAPGPRPFREQRGKGGRSERAPGEGRRLGPQQPSPDSPSTNDGRPEPI